MPILANWEDRLAEVQPIESPRAAACKVPRSPDFYAGQTVFVETADEATALAELASQRPLAWIGIDFEYKYDRPGAYIDRNHTAQDPRSIHPLLLSLTLAEPDGNDGGRFYSFVVDVRRPEVLSALRTVLRLPACFVAHYAQAELLCLLKLRLPEPRILWDSWVHEKALHLGRNHKRYKLKPGANEAEQACVGEEIEKKEVRFYSLVTTCQRYGVPYPFAGDKERLQASFLDHGDKAQYTAEQIEYAAADATAAASLYPHQVLAATRAGILHHLQTVEMPWTVTNTRMVWHGVRVDQEKCRLASEACERHLADLQPQLAHYGIPNVCSHKQLFTRIGLLDLFRRGPKISFDKSQLADLKDHHPAIPLIRAARRVHDLQKEKILTGGLTGCDGRVHPEYKQLGTHSGRQTSRWPNVLGLGRVFRPFIVPEPGRGIGELDWSQIEVGIAAAVYHDDRLVQMFNSGDVYSAMAQDFYRDLLLEEDRSLPGHQFKKKHRDLRNRMKTCTLGIIYGLTAHGLALYLDTSKSEAAALLDRFMVMFPTLKQALVDVAIFGGMRGYANTVCGLRRYRGNTAAQLSNWERNWMTNQPVQGSAAVVFKAAGNRLDKLYRRHDAWLVVPVHDAFVFEAPLSALKEIADLSDRVMCDVVQEYFPELQPKIEVNIEQPGCWNKDGHADSIEHWMQDPTYTF